MYEWREYKEEADENTEACACEWKTLDICLLESIFSWTEMSIQNTISVKVYLNKMFFNI